MDDLTKVLLAFVAVVPTAATGFAFWLLERKIEQRAKHEDEARQRRQRELDAREEARQKNEILTIQLVNAALALGEATARAVKRIPESQCNGDMDGALEYAEKIKHEHKQFLYEQSVSSIYRKEGTT